MLVTRIFKFCLRHIIPMVEKHTFDSISIYSMARYERTYHDQKAIIKPNHANVNTLPYLLNGFRIGMERALPLTGLISGDFQRLATLKPILFSSADI